MALLIILCKHKIITCPKARPVIPNEANDHIKQINLVMTKIITPSDHSEMNFMDHLALEQTNLNISLWNSGARRAKIIKEIDSLLRDILNSRKILKNGYTAMSEEEVLCFELYAVFRRYLFCTLSALFRGYYGISLANARVAIEASMYTYIFYHDTSLKEEYKKEKQLKKLYDKFDNLQEKKADLGEVNNLLSIFNLCSKRGSHCDYAMIEETTIRRVDHQILTPHNDLLNDDSGELDKKLFDILRGFLVALRIFNLAINHECQKFFISYQSKLKRLGAELDKQS